VADDWVKTTVRELTEWAGKRRGEFDLAGAELLLELAHEGLGLSGVAELGSEELRSLLLEEFPDVVVANPDDVPAVLATAGTLVDFLGETGAVPPGRPEILRAELKRLEPEFTEIIAENDAADQEAAFEVLARMMRADGVDLTDEKAMERWVREFEALPEQERNARTLPYLSDQEDETTVPPVRLASQAELAAAVRESRLLTDVRDLVAWATGRELTEDDELTAADADAAAEALGLSTPRRRDEDIPEISRLWWAALEVELVTGEDGTAAPGAGQAALDGTDEELLDLWLRMFDDVTTLDPDEDDQLTPYEVVQNELPGVLLHLYEQERPSTLEELAGALAEHILQLYEVGDDDPLEGAAEYALELELGDLSEWGVVEGGPEGFQLTPLGVWGVRELLIADGYTAPLVGDLALGPADALIEGLAWHGEDTADEEIELWLERREPIAAATELIELMQAGTPGTRHLAAAVLHHVDMAAAPVLREALTNRLTRPYATLWLHEHGDDTTDMAPTEMMWIFIDMVAGLLETAQPAEAIAASLADVPDEVDLFGMVKEMWRIDHPDVTQVLEALGDHHPDKGLAKAARKAAFKARSAQEGA
jgi:hypothetical protein